MTIGAFDVAATVRVVEDCLDGLQTAVQSSYWKKLPEQERTRLVFRLSHILETAEMKELRE